MIAWSIYQRLTLWDHDEIHSTITKREKRRDGAINELASWNLMIREKKHFPPRTLLRHISGSLSLHTSTEYLQNRYWSFSYGHQDSTRFVQPTSHKTIGEMPRGSNSYRWSVCTGRLYTGVVPLLMALLTRSKILVVANNVSPVSLVSIYSKNFWMILK